MKYERVTFGKMPDFKHGRQLRVSIPEAVDHIAELEDKITLVGEKVYLNHYTDDGDILAYTVTMVAFDNNGCFFEIDDEESSRVYFDDETLVGVEVFFTEAEAKAHIESAHPLTNREWLEGLSDEELSNKLKTLSLCERTLDCDNCLLGEDGCKNILDWLKAKRNESK